MREKQNILVQILLPHLGLTANIQLKIHKHWTTFKYIFLFTIFQYLDKYSGQRQDARVANIYVQIILLNT